MVEIKSYVISQRCVMCGGEFKIGHIIQLLYEGTARHFLCLVCSQKDKGGDP